MATATATAAAPASEHIPLLRKIVIGGGDFGLNLYWQSSSLFLLFFYTEILGLSAAIAGLIYMTALIWDAAIDPVIGAIADRTRTRWGRYRPYLLAGSVPLAVAFVLVFALPMGSGSTLVALTTGGHFLFRTLYAIVAIPYASLFARVTRDSGERATMAGIRMVFALIAAIGVSAVTLPMARTLGDGVHGWVLLGAVYGALACIFLAAAAIAAGGEDSERPGEGKSWAGFGETSRILIKNRPLLIVLGIVLVSSFASTFFSKNLLYYFKYARGDAEFGGTALAIMATVSAFAAPVWANIAKNHGKRIALLIGMSLYTVGLMLWFLFNAASVPMLMAILLLIALGASAGHVCFWAMLPDTVEYGEWRTGVRTESLVFGFVIFAQKAALGLGAGGLGLALAGVGFVPDSQQSPETLRGLVAMMALVPLMGGVGTMVLAWFYPISPAMHRGLRDDIAARAASIEPTI